jgi:hypothetical protein
MLINEFGGTLWDIGFFLCDEAFISKKCIGKSSDT